jgi:peptide-methionine (S)-S-oxide reductase
MLFSRQKTQLVAEQDALRGRDEYPFTVPDSHVVLGTPIKPPFPEGLASIVFGLGCFWGAEEVFWKLPGVWTTAVGYAGGYTQHPTYEEVCSGRTGHTEAVLVVYDPAKVSLEDLLATFFEVHDPTQGMRQGNDIGTQYRSAIYYTDETQHQAAEHARDVYAARLEELGFDPVTTEIAPMGPFFYAEDYHQQYLAKNPFGYRCHANTGVPFPRTAPQS